MAKGAPVSHRRRFLGWLAASGAALGLVGLEGTGTGADAARHPGPAAGTGAGEPWLNGMTGTHRQIFDTPSLNGGKVLRQAQNFLNAYNEAYGVPDAEVNAAVLTSGGALPLVFGDAAWDRYGFGERFGVDDPATGEPARRNIFAHEDEGGAVPAGASVQALQRRGVVFLVCNNALKGIARGIAAGVDRSLEKVRRELAAGLLPGVVVVSAAVVAVNRAQEHGISYIHSG